MNRWRTLALFGVATSAWAGAISACIDAPPTVDDRLLDAISPADVSAASDASDNDSADPLCDLVAWAPDADSDALNDGSTDASSQLRCSVPVKQTSAAPLSGSDPSKPPLFGDNPICALSEGGDLYCWGSNSMGGVGIGEVSDSVSTPTKILSNVASMNAGPHGVCAIQEDGMTFCWGDNTYQQVSEDTATTAEPAPTLVKKSDGSPLLLSQVATGEWFSCGIELDTGKVWCWGGTDPGPKVAAARVSEFEIPPAALPAQNISVSAGTTHACAIGADNVVYCWGNDVRGKLGYAPSDGSTYSATPTKIGNLSNVAEVSAGRSTTCARLINGEVWCWGSNGYAQFGTGLSDTNRHAAPIKIASLPPGVTAIDARGESVMATTATGDVLGWGYVGVYSLGDGVIPTTACENGDACQTAPRRIGFLQPMARMGTTVGLARDRTVWAWGSYTLIAQKVAIVP
ncbi:MAG: hypothetical protein FWD69_02070 [Polyangiaceae bacterium]|nr:hypothetical protein [Polyangiaceae bacterium]